MSVAEMPAKVTLRRQLVKCGKRNCARLHGPYWYAEWWTGGKVRTAYVGTDDALERLLGRRPELELAVAAHDTREEMKAVLATLCRELHARTGLRCEKRRKHKGGHLALRRSGRALQWGPKRSRVTGR